MIFNGIDISEYLRITEIRGRGIAGHGVSLLEVPGRSGAYYRGRKLPPRQIEISATILADNPADLRDAIREINGILNVSKPVSISFKDDPSLTYFGIPEAVTEGMEFTYFHQNRITLICPDPLAYSNETTQNLSSNPVIPNEGTEETFPTFNFTINRPLTEIEITNRSIEGSPSIILGRDATVEQAPYQREELVLHDSMQSTAEWQQGSVIDEGHVSGNITVDKDGFYAEEYGEIISNTDWQGPSLQRGIGVSLRDFRADVKLESKALPNGTGMIEVYLRDANGNVVVKLGLGDNWRDVAQNYFRMQVGSLSTGWRQHTYADKRQWWEHFNGIMRVERVGNTYSFYFAQIDKDGVHHGRRTGIRYVAKSSTPITSVQVAFRKYAPYETKIRMRVSEVKIYRINQPQNNSNSVPYLGNAGDVFSVDNRTSRILRNGEFVSELANLDTEFFPLIKGYNRIEVSPKDAVNLGVTYRKAYL